MYKWCRRMGYTHTHTVYVHRYDNLVINCPQYEYGNVKQRRLTRGCYYSTWPFFFRVVSVCFCMVILKMEEDWVDLNFVISYNIYSFYKYCAKMIKLTFYTSFIFINSQFRKAATRYVLCYLCGLVNISIKLKHTYILRFFIWFYFGCSK